MNEIILTLPGAESLAETLAQQLMGLVAPYLPYMRQDERFHPGEAITSRSYARILSTALDCLVTVDPNGESAQWVAEGIRDLGAWRPS